MKTIKNRICKICAAVLALTLLFSITVQAAPGCYIHDPARNATAMEDIIVDPNAVYGYRPDPNSTRLGPFADADWSDPAVVAKAQLERVAYHNDFVTMYDTWKKMEAAGKPIETIARTVSAMRNEIRLASYKDDPAGLARAKASNLAKYGDENGPTADSLFEKYGSWETVLIKSFSENPGMDACLGLYDIYYDNYKTVGSLKELSAQTYTVREGDSLSTISSKYYGTNRRWVDVYNANKPQISDPNLIYVGQKITVPVQ